MSYRDYFQKKMFIIFLWAFSSGIPLLLVTSTLSARLIQANISLAKIGIFAATLLPYSVKFILAPFVEKYSVPLLRHHAGHASSWMILSMSGMILSLNYMASLNIENNQNQLGQLFIAALLTALFGAINDTAEAKLRLKLLDHNELAIGTACYINGFNCGELMAGGAALFLAGVYGWNVSYRLISLFLFIGIITLFFGQSIIRNDKQASDKPIFLKEIIVTSVKGLAKVKLWYWAIPIIILYYLNSYLSLMVSTPFYIQAGFSITQIGVLRSIPASILLILGGAIGGIVCKTIGIYRLLIITLVLYMINIAVQAILAFSLCEKLIVLPDSSIDMLFHTTILLPNLVDGISLVGYIALIASLCKSSFISMQNALLTSLMAGSKIIFSSLGGYVVKHLGWAKFFIINLSLAVPLLLLLLIAHLADIKTSENCLD